ncbi:MAG: HDIG domain-containing protein, partial [Verrucomicrobia bacterium]|nr:HDIG domain-containing protein [Verrucomicrobiota bacterium]
MTTAPSNNTPSSRRWRLDRGRIVRLSLFATALLVLWGLFAIGDTSGLVDLTPAQRCPRTIISSIDFDFQDKDATEAERARAAASVVPIWQLSTEHLTNSWRRITLLADRFVLGNVKDAVERWNESSRYALSAEEAAAFAQFAADQTRLAKTERLLRKIAEAGIVADRLELEATFAQGSSDVILPPAKDHVNARDFLTPSQALQLFEKQLLAAIPEAAAAHAAWRQLAADVLQPNLRFNREATQREQEKARQAVPPVLRPIARGRAILFQGQRVTEESLELVRAYTAELNRLRPPEARRIELTGQALLVLVVLLATCGYLWSNHPQTLTDTRQLLLLLILAVMNLALVKAMMIFCSRTVLVTFATAQFAIPTALAPLLAGALLHPALGVFMAVFVSVFTALMAGDSFSLLITGLVSGFAGVYFTRQMRRRSHIVRAGLAIAVAELLCIGSLAAMTHTKFDALWPQAVAGLVNGAFTIFLASGLLPVFEYLFKLTTDIRLLELSDLHHPLLRKLCFAAPGTYHHSLVVGNLAESAAEAIGANPLLARVCAYYHDIGKAEQPQFFAENQTSGVNPHDPLPPAESFRIIAEHIRAGEEVARKYHLSPPIVDAIRQHHGTTLLRTMYLKATRLAEQAAAVVRPFSAGKTAAPSPIQPPAEQDYRYAGPKPQFRESAIVFLADPIESASRTLPNAAPETVRAMV